MVIVIFEAEPNAEHEMEYFDLATQLLPSLQKIDGFISIERFKSLTQTGKLLSLSLWRGEQAINEWRNNKPHQSAQQKGKQHIFRSYKISVAQIIRHYEVVN